MISRHVEVTLGSAQAPSPSNLISIRGTMMHTFPLVPRGRVYDCRKQRDLWTVVATASTSRPMNPSPLLRLAPPLIPLVSMPCKAPCVCPLARLYPIHPIYCHTRTLSLPPQTATPIALMLIHRTAIDFPKDPTHSQVYGTVTASSLSLCAWNG